jgi:hypothetical protein
MFHCKRHGDYDGKITTFCPGCIGEFIRKIPEGQGRLMVIDTFLELLVLQAHDYDSLKIIVNGGK